MGCGGVQSIGNKRLPYLHTGCNVWGVVVYSPLEIKDSPTFIQGVMVRLMLVLAPVMCVLSGIAVTGILGVYMRNLDVIDTKAKAKKKADTSYPVKNEVCRQSGL